MIVIHSTKFQDFPGVSMEKNMKGINIHVGFPGGSVVKNLPGSAGNRRDTGSIPGSGRSPGVGNGTPLQFSCLENPMDRGAWWAMVHEVAKSQARLKQFSTQASNQNSSCAQRC